MLVLIDLNPRSDGAFRALALYEFKQAQDHFQIWYFRNFIHHVLVMKRSVSVRDKHRRQGRPSTNIPIRVLFYCPPFRVREQWIREAKFSGRLSVCLYTLRGYGQNFGFQLHQLSVSYGKDLQPLPTRGTFAPVLKENDNILPHFIVPQFYLSPLT